MKKLDSIHVKGKKDPIDIFLPFKSDSAIERAEKQTSAAHRSRPMIGRESEKALIFEALRSLSDQSFSVVCRGPHGIGKTRLSQEIVTLAHELQYKTSFASLDSIDTETAFLVFGVITTQVLDLGTDAKTNQNKILGVLAGMTNVNERNDCFSHTALLNDILLVEFQETPSTLKLASDPVQIEEKRSKLLLNLLSQVSKEKPQVFIIEDAHCIDPASWKLFSAMMAAHDLPIMVFFEYRSSTLIENHDFDCICDSMNSCFIELLPLKPDEIQTMLSLELGIENAAFPDKFASQLRSQTQGNPFFAKEIVRGLLAKGDIKIEEGALIGNLQSIVIPSNLQSVIVANFDSLDPDLQLVLKVASSLGKIFDFDVLKSIYPTEVPIEDLEADIEELRELGFFKRLGQLRDSQKRTGSPENGIVFSSHLFSKVAYNMLLDNYKQTLHLSAATFYENRFKETDNLSSVIRPLVFHLEKAKRHDQAEHYKNRLKARKRWHSSFKMISAVRLWQTSPKTKELITITIDSPRVLPVLEDPDKKPIEPK